MLGEFLEKRKTPDGFSWELYRHSSYGSPCIWFAIHPVTGERLCGGAVFNDPDECIRFMDLPR